MQATRAEAGIRTLEREPILLQPPNEEELRETLGNLRDLYQGAYEWAAPDPVALLDGPTSQNSIRYKIRACINEWDLRRLYPNSQPEIEGREFVYSYEEMPEMEQEVPDDE